MTKQSVCYCQVLFCVTAKEDIAIPGLGWWNETLF